MSDVHKFGKFVSLQITCDDDKFGKFGSLEVYKIVNELISLEVCKPGYILQEQTTRLIS